jgi:hypothetical protein
MLRQTDKTDTRLEIRRDEKREHGQKSLERKAEPDEVGLWEDSASVSVAALRNFLGEFLKARGEADIATPAPSTNPFDLQYTPAPLTPASSVAARAMKAYGAHTPPPLAPAPEPQAGGDAQGEISLSDLLKADELRTIHALIASLNDLEKRGVQTLTIEKAGTFLQSLVNAVEAEKTIF